MGKTYKYDGMALLEARELNECIDCVINCWIRIQNDGITSDSLDANIKSDIWFWQCMERAL